MPTGSRTSQYKKLGKRKEHAVFDRVLLLLFSKFGGEYKGSIFFSGVFTEIAGQPAGNRRTDRTLGKEGAGKYEKKGDY